MYASERRVCRSELSGGGGFCGEFDTALCPLSAMLDPPTWGITECQYTVNFGQRENPGDQFAMIGGSYQSFPKSSSFAKPFSPRPFALPVHRFVGKDLLQRDRLYRQ